MRPLCWELTGLEESGENWPSPIEYVEKGGAVGPIVGIQDVAVLSDTVD